MSRVEQTDSVDCNALSCQVLNVWDNLILLQRHWFSVDTVPQPILLPRSIT